MREDLLSQFKKISDTVWELPKSYKEGMLVPARIYGTEKIMNDMDDKVVDQLTNVACLPGIQKFAFCMADGHSGYGFPIGGVAGFDLETGIISPGGIGFDINCGMRLIATNLHVDEVRPKIKELVDTLFELVPAGTGKKGTVAIDMKELNQVLEKGSEWCVEKGYGWKEDLERTEDYGKIDHADSKKVSQKAKGRGMNQLGTLGSGNHYLEIQYVKEGEIYDEEIAKRFGITGPGQVVIMVHCGSRGVGHQIGTDYLSKFLKVMPKYGIKVLDRELACAPFKSEEGQDYYHAMACGANFAFANRQVITHNIRKAFEQVFNKDAKEMEMSVIYDVTHNIAKIEKYNVDGVEKDVIVHRKGATRSFGPGNKSLAPIYRDVGQPVIVGGSMETGSYLFVGTKTAEDDTFGSTLHGAGRTMSRTQAKKQVKGEQLQKRMESEGIYVKTATYSGLAEEAGFAYKDIDEVARAMDKSGIVKTVVALRPIGNVKG
jgi:tRNA-splicing ligase RtcB